MSTRPRHALRTLVAAFGITLAAGLVLPRAGAQELSGEPTPAAWRSAEHVVVPQSRSFRVDRRSGRAPVARSVEIRAVRAHVTIRGTTARTTLQIDLFNPGGRDAESILLLPVPAAAAVSGFDFQGAGAEPSATLLPAIEARRTYDDIVRRARDPALLEFAGATLVRSSVFPVPANGTQRVRLTYEEVLDTHGTRVDYVLPRSESLDVTVPWTVEVAVDGEAPISTLYSPSHELATERRDAEKLTARVASTTEPGSFRLSYLRGEEGLSGTLYAYPDPELGGGYFLFLGGLPPRTEEDRASIQREVTIALDRSGSMAGPKMDQARQAALQVIEGLADGESFNLVDYGTTVSRFAKGPVKKTRDTTLAARAYLDSLRPGGGTNLHDALVESLSSKPSEGTLPLVLFLTDGLPTVGRTDEGQIGRLAERAGGKRVFTFGVGNDVNAPLLDRIADTTRASAGYVLPDQDIEVAVSEVFDQLYGPLLTDVSLTALDGDTETTRAIHDVIPGQSAGTIPDVFEGDQIVVLGKYRDADELRLRLSGRAGDEQLSHEFTFDLADATTAHSFVPRLWAVRRIAFLSDQVRQQSVAGNRTVTQASQELVDEIVRLSTRFGVLSDYTAFLALEGSDLSDWDGLVATCNSVLDRRAVRTRSGADAVAQGVNFNGAKWAQVLNNRNERVAADLSTVTETNVQQVADRALFKRGIRWIDSRAIEDRQVEPDRVVEYGSAEHLALLHELVAEGRQSLLANGHEILVRHKGENVLVRNPTPER